MINVKRRLKADKCIRVIEPAILPAAT